MNPPKVRDEDYINFIIAMPRVGTTTEASSCQPEPRHAPSHDAFTRLLSRLEPDPETLWTKVQPQIDLNKGILVIDDSTLEKPYSPRNALLYRHWSENQKAVVSGITLITLLWTDGERCVPVDVSNSSRSYSICAASQSSIFPFSKIYFVFNTNFRFFVTFQ